MEFFYPNRKFFRANQRFVLLFVATESSKYGHEPSEQDCLDYSFHAAILESTEGRLEILDRGFGDFEHRNIVIVRIHHHATESAK
jgi:hypothetical protein